MLRNVRFSDTLSWTPRNAGAFHFYCLISAFTAIELVGVLSIIALLASALVPQVIKRIDRAAWEREGQDLNTMAEGLVQAIKTDRRIPSAISIIPVIASYRNLAPNQVATNPRRFNRVLLVDPLCNVAGNNLQITSYLQSNVGPGAPPSNIRLLFLSTLAQPALPGNGSINFNQVWDTPEGSVPASLGSRRADDLRIQRLDLGSLFHRLRLHNIDVNPGWYTFDGNAPNNVAPFGNSLTFYVLDGTAVNLYAGDPSTLQFRDILTEDRSFVYQNGHWSPDLTTPQLSANLGQFGNTVAQFLSAGWNDPEAGARPQAAIETFYNYMVDYIVWSRGDPAHGIPSWQGARTTSAPQYPYFKLLNDAQLELDSVTGYLIK